ncbi:mitochondrial import inner membrane translocase subunit Tim29 [Rhinatrema bivittatum]|uniref:mitochondrial import inner membrane translocase subunit Tim29 n=1 Tax=Rhinatrema bivittatum TaxID=194408 RepID=UPI00112B4853|nr:mitochondrial import inner membrane translocase subunit Tim29 [Rhinatrema bivittatum]
MSLLGGWRPWLLRQRLLFHVGRRARSVEAGSSGMWPRIQNSRVGAWCRSLLSDYAEACKDVALGVRERPGRAAFYLALLAGAGACARSTPAPGSFECSLLEAAGALLLLSPSVRSASADGHVQELLQLRDQGRLRYRSLGCCALVYRAAYDADCALYRASCRHLREGWAQFPARLLDVGFLGRWWLLRAKMRDFDVNEEAFRHLPAHLRSLSAGDLHSGRNERLFEEKYRAGPDGGRGGRALGFPRSGGGGERGLLHLSDEMTRFSRNSPGSGSRIETSQSSCTSPATSSTCNEPSPTDSPWNCTAPFGAGPGRTDPCLRPAEEPRARPMRPARSSESRGSGLLLGRRWPIPARTCRGGRGPDPSARPVLCLLVTARAARALGAKAPNNELLCFVG